MTRGVRADRIGVALAPRGPQGPTQRAAGGASRPVDLRRASAPPALTRETSARACRCVDAGPRSFVQQRRRYPFPVRGSVVRRGFGSASRSIPRRARQGGARERTPGSCPWIQDGDRTVPWSCSRVESVAESAWDAIQPVRAGFVSRRWKASGERPKLSPLTRRRWSRAQCSEAKGIRQRCRIRRGAREDVRGRVASPTRGRERRRRERERGGAFDRGSTQDRAPSHAGSLRGARVVAAGPKLELRRQARLHLVGSSGMRIGEGPEPRHRGQGPG